MKDIGIIDIVSMKIGDDARIAIPPVYGYSNAFLWLRKVSNTKIEAKIGNLLGK